VSGKDLFSREELEAYDRDGFVVVRELFDDRAMAEIRTWTEEVQAWPETPGKWMMYFDQSLREPGARILNRIENFCPYHSGFADLVESEALAGRVGALFGEPAVLFKEKINFKLPGGGGFAPHQDIQAGWEVYAPLFITAMVSVDPATPENGCLEFAAGRHKRGLLGENWKPLTDADLEGARFVPCPTAPGDAVFFDCYAPHRSAPNLSDTPRRVLYVTYNRASDGDHRMRYYADKRKSYPPDCEREPGKEYRYKV